MFLFLGVLCAIIPRANTASINYDLSSIVYLKLNVGNVECPIVFCGVRTLCPIDFRGSGHFMLSILISVCITVYFVSISTS